MVYINLYKNKIIVTKQNSDFRVMRSSHYHQLISLVTANFISGIIKDEGEEMVNLTRSKSPDQLSQSMSTASSIRRNVEDPKV